MPIFLVILFGVGDGTGDIADNLMNATRESQQGTTSAGLHDECINMKKTVH